MADNSKEENLDNPTNNQTENSSDKIITDNDTDAINPNQEIENMEVHHHAHHEHGKKNWKSYFWEFLMLFLAVFCGFFAEYQLEHVIEHQREKQYAQTLYNDLKKDTSLLNSALDERDFVISKIDTFCMLVHFKAIDEIPSGTWYYFGRFGTRTKRISLQDATLQQLLSSGGLRYFKNHNVTYAIAQYDQSLKEMQDAFDFQDLLVTELVKARNVIFDAWYFQDIMDITVRNGITDTFKKKSFPLLTNKKEDFVQYANLCQFRSYDIKSAQIKIKNLVNNAETLLTLLKREYHLK